MIDNRLYHVDADWVPRRSDIAPPHWVCSTFKEAADLVDSIRTTSKQFTNVHVRETGY
jgi:hypothetical protein